MNQDYSNLHGRLIKFDLSQKQYLEKYSQKRPQNVLVLGPFGCGKTVFVTQFFAIKVSEYEDLKIPYRVIVCIDMKSKNSQLLQNMKTKNFGFLETEINGRRTLNNEEPIEVTFTTLNDLMVKHNVVPDTKKDLKVMKRLTKNDKRMTEMTEMTKMTKE